MRRPRPRPWPPSGAWLRRAPPTDLTAAAFFDVDNTMMVGASIFHFARGLAARKFFTTSDLLGFAWQQMKFRIGGRELSYGHTTGRDTALSFVAGRPVADIVELGEEIYDELMADRIWAGTRALAQLHLDAGQRVWLVTATPVELALIIARRLGLTGALGTVAESVDGALHRPAGRRGAARPGEGARGARAGRHRGPRPAPLHGLLGLGERRADAVGGRARRWPSTRTATCATSPAPAAGRSATSARAGAPPASRCRRCSGPARWPARWPRACAAGG